MWIIEIIANIILFNKNGNRTPLRFAIIMSAVVLVGAIIAILTQSSLG